ncbi:MAG TPA: hypothetical protein DEP57_09230, partial [Selenomonas sp.]|nr:hypothetical protein [Selenomonas sp.]
GKLGLSGEIWTVKILFVCHGTIASNYNSKAPALICRGLTDTSSNKKVIFFRTHKNPKITIIEKPVNTRYNRHSLKRKIKVRHGAMFHVKQLFSALWIFFAFHIMI